MLWFAFTVMCGISGPNTLETCYVAPYPTPLATEEECWNKHLEHAEMLENHLDKLGPDFVVVERACYSFEKKVGTPS